MSRSYKKHPVVKGNCKGQKQVANRKIRRVDKLTPLKGGSYKKLYLTWNICDFRSRWTEEDAITEWYEEETEMYEENNINSWRHYPWRHERFGSLENWLNYWRRCVKRK